jgi:hypothetical protein
VKIYKVVWEDAHGDVGGWMTTAELDTKPRTVISVGFLAKRTKKVVILVSSVDEDADFILDPLVIPRQNVKEMKCLRQ